VAFHYGSRNFSLAMASGRQTALICAFASNSSPHQFTITSAPEDPYVSIHIRQVGDFTRALGERLGVGPSVVAAMTSAALKGSEKDERSDGSRGDFVELDSGGGTLSLPSVRIDGPFGAPAEDVFRNEVAILIGAGIGRQLLPLDLDGFPWLLHFYLPGVTPFASILKHIWYRQKKGALGSLRRVEFFWVCRDAPSFGWFQSLLQEVEAAQADRESLVLTFSEANVYNTFF
jgi:NADPH oxidase 1